MKKIISIIVAALLILLTCVPAYAAEKTVDKVPSDTNISVYARYVDNTDFTTIPTDENGNGSITLPGGTEITISGADTAKGRIVVEEVTDKEVLDWAVKLLGSNAKGTRIFYIYQIQDDGTVQPVSGVTVTVNTADNTTYTVYSLKDNTSSKLNDSSGNGSVSFKVDGSSFYALCKVSGKTPSGTSPQTGDNRNLALWIALLFVSGAALLVVMVIGAKKSRRTNRE